MTKSGFSGAGDTLSTKPAGWRLKSKGLARFACCLFPAVFLLAGCGGGKGDVTGEVTYKGEPLTVGRITFLSEVGTKDVISAYIIRGKYTIKSCPAGPVKITIESIEPPDPEKLKATEDKINKFPMAKGMMSRVEMPPEIMELASGPKLKYIQIPLKYANPETSELTYEVRKGPQSFDIPLR